MYVIDMELKMAKVPTKITPCPIVEAVVELRFDTKTQPDVVTGILSNEFQADYPTRSSLPVMNLPEEIRLNDPQLKFAPWFRLKGEAFLLHLGPAMVSVICLKEYKGWQRYREAILKAFNIAARSKVETQMQQIGLKYTSFFENNIFNNTKAVISLSDCSLLDKKTFLESKFEQDNFECMVKMINCARLDTRQGSVVEIGVNTQLNQPMPVNQHGKTIDQAHAVQKQIFFSLLTKDFLNTLKPEGV